MRGNRQPDLIADPQGPFHGPLAHALACAVHIAVNAGVAWNSPNQGCTCCTKPKQKRKMLKRDWGIDSAEDWRSTAETLLSDRSSNSTAALLLGMRTQLAQQYRQPIDARTWRDAFSAWCRQEGITDNGYQQLLGLMGMILDYEKRFTADGLLPPGGFVSGIGAWDYGRAANMARWGIQCEYTDPPTMQWFATRASEQARRHHASWADFSAGYILGRCLHFDEGEFGSWYTTPLAVHQTMMSHPQSPWLHMPFHI
ncbi:DUF1266 domain-containing protein [Nocardiopsis sediminis]|uniref:DUF1266 domain-containing protein n=1 Tax=Nocardiopsis sediminis TaxID=1778267 RepID=A0ABV8FFH8_9ACTN